MEYPKYEVIFALQREDDQALDVVKTLLEEYPEVDARVVIGGPDTYVHTLDS
jgi:ceramide glucosyltransferase